jgi:hypothetical protein
MDNMNWPPEGGGQDAWPTQELGPAWPGPGHPAGPAPEQPPGRPRRGSRLRRWGIGGTAAAVLVLGGAGTAAALSGGSPGSGSPGSGTPTTEMGALVSAASSQSGSSGSAAGTASAAAAGRLAKCRQIAAQLKADGHPLAARFVARRCARGARRLRLLGGIHGQVTYESEKGPRTLEYERGTITSVSGTSMVVNAADGTTWTWDLVSNTVVRQDHKKATASALAIGQRVFAGGPLSGSTRDARLVVIRPAAKAGSSPGSSGGAGSASGS